MASRLSGSLRFSEAEYGWALDIGSFLAAWATAIRGLVYSETDETRRNFVQYSRLYAFNIVRRLSVHDIKIDVRTFEPKDLSGMLAALAEVTRKVKAASSADHCAFLLLGSATTYVELGLKSGMPLQYYDQLRECAISAIKQMRDMGFYPAEMQPEAVRIELLRLAGNVDNLRKTLSSGPAHDPAPVPAIQQTMLHEAHDRKKASVVSEQELPELMVQAAI